jgi:YjbE family integral membrane protein
LELFSSEFFAALAAIVVIDLVLAGDNAIVIALAARNLPARQRRLAIIWGTFGAIAVRAAMTVIVVWLLKIPGLMFFGGLMLIWIAYRLLVPKAAGDNGHHVQAAGGFWAAMGTIVIADAMMGLDNVLAVAGAAHGSYLLVVLGLLISIPIVVWGSQLVLKLIDRFPAITYLGSGVLALTAAKMISDEPYVKEAITDENVLRALLYGVLVAGILALAFLRNQFRRQDLLEARLLDVVSQLDRTAPRTARILVPVDGSRNALNAVERVIEQCAPGAQPPEIHLLHVRSPLSRHIAGFLRRADINVWHREEGLKALAGAMALLAEKGIAFAHHVRVGQRAATIAALAQELNCDRIVMGTARRNTVTRVLEDSVTSEVLELARAPVEVIVGKQSSAFERMGLAVSLVAAIALAALIAD